MNKVWWDKFPWSNYDPYRYPISRELYVFTLRLRIADL